MWGVSGWWIIQQEGEMDDMRQAGGDKTTRVLDRGW